MRSNVLLKAFVVAVVAVAFIVPLIMIWNVVRDRSRYRDTVTAEVARSTAQSQALVGPLVLVRYRERIPAALKGGAEQIRDGVEVLLPDSLSIRSKVLVETRKRGIYRVPVFRSATGFAAGFTLPSRFGISDKHQLLEEPRAEVVFGVSDPRGIRAVPKVRVDSATLEARPGAGLDWLQHGFSVALPPDAAGRRVALDANLEVMGTDRLMFLPIGAVTDVEVTSEWPHPGFVGAFLPDERSVSARGFQARWKLSRFATGVDDAMARIRDSMSRGVPITADGGGGAPGFHDTDLGVRFVQPVDVYSQSERAVKYGFLFVFLTFVAFFLFEVLRRMAVHPIQYALCGAALALFFLLLVSLSEHLPFAAAYLVASGACVGLIAFYVGHVLRSTRRGVVFGGLLGALYGFLYVILQSEDYALLLGALLLFAALTIVMVMTRRVDWYRLSEESPTTR
jgi:inner membrane protein